MTVLDERIPGFGWGSQDPTLMDRLPEIIWDDNDTRPQPNLVAELEALYGLEYKPVPRAALPRRAEVRNTPPGGIALTEAKPARRPASQPRREQATPELAARTVCDDGAARQRVRIRSTKALVMALFIAADTYAAVTLAGPPAALSDLFTSNPETSAPAAAALTSSSVLASSADRAQSALALREAGDHAGRSLSDSAGGKVRAALSQAAAADARARAVVAARQKALAEARSNPRGIARVMVADMGWNSSQFSCLSSLWNRESGWNYRISNSSSGAYGIPQSLPGSKMASAGSDWRTNPVTQIRWGLDYIADRYGTPCGAWGHSESHGWY